VNAQDVVGRTALAWAVLNPSIEVASILVAAQANLNLATLEGDTPLLRALQFGNLDIAKYFISCGSDLVRKNKNGQDAMKIAQASGYGEIVEMLHKGSGK